jgi:NUMOD4 motif-containing protein
VEKWKTIVSFEAYSISSHGRIRNDITERILKPSLSHETGHTKIGLRRDGRQHHKAVGKLVAIHFVPAAIQSYFQTPIHLNGDLTDCWASNLMWRPKSFATKYHIQMRGERYRLPPFHDTKTGEYFEDAWDLIMRDGLLFRDLSMSITNRTYVFPTMRCYAFGSLLIKKGKTKHDLHGL